MKWVRYAALAVAAFLLGQLSVLEDRRPIPALIAHDCIGAGGDLWAMEESDFPTQCDSVERWN